MAGLRTPFSQWHAYAGALRTNRFRADEPADPESPCRDRHHGRAGRSAGACRSPDPISKHAQRRVPRLVRSAGRRAGILIHPLRQFGAIAPRLHARRPTRADHFLRRAMSPDVLFRRPRTARSWLSMSKGGNENEQVYLARSRGFQNHAADRRQVAQPARPGRTFGQRMIVQQQPPQRPRYRCLYRRHAQSRQHADAVSRPTGSTGWPPIGRSTAAGC